MCFRIQITAVCDRVRRSGSRRHTTTFVPDEYHPGSGNRHYNPHFKVKL